MKNEKISTIAILGGGPAASTLAIRLRQKNFQVAIFHTSKRAPIIVGESLVPAIIPILQELGVEDEVKSYSQFKTGATFNISPGENYTFWFEHLIGTTRYSYNVPRDKFDDTILNAARKAGVKIIEAAAAVEKVSGTDDVKLSADTLALAADFFHGQQPDLVVDATGRLRLLPNLFGIGAQEGPRQDTALYAHVDQTLMDHVGHVHSTLIDRGWSWRIPLPGKVSVGMVVPSEHAAKFGATKEERFDNLLQQDSVLKKLCVGTKRLTPVMEYKNYQLVSDRMSGGNWVLAGDSAGFIDPVFSSGLYLGMFGASLLAMAIEKNTPAAYAAYEKELKHHLHCWHEIVSYFYDGRLFTFFRAGEALKDNFIIKLSRPHIAKHLGRIFSGAASTSNYSLGLLRFSMNNALRGADPKLIAVK